MKVIGWMHIARMGSWKEILEEQFQKIESSGLLEVTSEVHAYVCGPHEEYSYPAWLTVHEGGDLKMGECPTLQHLWDYAKEHPSGAVWYCHAKGCSKPGSVHDIEWRRWMEKYVILGWHDCMDALETHDACGVEWVTPHDPDFERVWKFPVPGDSLGAFLGNFWWARMDYLARLPVDKVDLSKTRYDAEWCFIGAGLPRVKCLAKTGLNLYKSLPPGAPIKIISTVSPGELAALARLASGKKVLEIGSFLGRSTIALATTAKKVVAVDWHQGDSQSGYQETAKEFLDNLARYGARDKVIPMIGRSEEVGEYLSTDSFDFAFIDGHHTLEATGEYIDLVRRVVVPGGLIAFHDFFDRGDFQVKSAVESQFPELVEVVETLAVARNN